MEGGRKWLVLYTKSRAELKCAKGLQRKAYEIFCPTVKTLRHWKDRKKKVEVPLFNSYLFIKINESEIRQVLLDPLSVRFLYWQGKPAIVKDEEVELIQSFIGRFGKGQHEVKSFPYEKGMALEIKYGPLHGRMGKILEVKSGTVLLAIESFGTVIQAEVAKQNL